MSTSTTRTWTSIRRSTVRSPFDSSSLIVLRIDAGEIPRWDRWATDWLPATRTMTAGAGAVLSARDIQQYAGPGTGWTQSSSPVVPGILTSSTITSGRVARMRLRAASALSASVTSTSATSNVVLSNVRRAGSSSTNKIRKTRDLPFPYLDPFVGSTAIRLESRKSRRTGPRKPAKCTRFIRSYEYS